MEVERAVETTVKRSKMWMSRSGGGGARKRSSLYEPCGSGGKKGAEGRTFGTYVP